MISASVVFWSRRIKAMPWGRFLPSSAHSHNPKQSNPSLPQANFQTQITFKRHNELPSPTKTNLTTVKMTKQSIALILLGLAAQTLLGTALPVPEPEHVLEARCEEFGYGGVGGYPWGG